MRKRNLLLVLLFLITTAVTAQTEINLDQWLQAGPVRVHEPAFAKMGDINGEKFKNSDLLESIRTEFKRMPVASEPVALAEVEQEWQQMTVDEDSLIVTPLDGKNVIYLATYVDLDRWAEVDFKITTDALFELYIDGVKKHTKKVEKNGRRKIFNPAAPRETPVKIEAFEQQRTG